MNSLTIIDQHEDEHGDTHVLTKPKPKLKAPKMFKVILLNDDFTPMDFVILILQKYFAKTPQQATEIMMQVHKKGAGIAGVYTYEIAETKSYQVNDFARSQEYPLKSIIEEE